MASKLEPREKRPPLPTRTSQSPPNGSLQEISVITNIRATDVVVGLRRFPAAFYAIIRHSDLEWRTENKHSSMKDDSVEWNRPVQIPSDPSAPVCLEVFASFEHQPTLGTGEQLRKLTIAAQQLSDPSEKHILFSFFPKDDDTVSPCSSIVVTVGRLNGGSGDSLPSPLCSTRDTIDEVENATNRGHRALSCFRKHGERRDLDRSVTEFERALDACSLNHPCHAAVLSNLAMAKSILCRACDTNTSFQIPLSLCRNALAARPAGCADRPSTLIQLAALYLARFEKQRSEVDGAQVERLLHEVMRLGYTDHESRAVSFMLRLYATLKIGLNSRNSQSSVDSRSGSHLTDGDLGTVSGQFLKRFQRSGDLTDLERAIALLQVLDRSTPVWDEQYCRGLGNLGMALLWRFERLGKISDLEEAISTFRHVVHFTPDGHRNKSSRLNSLGCSLKTRFLRLGNASDLEDAIATLSRAVHFIPDGHPDKPSLLSNLGNCFIARFKRLGELNDLEDAISTHGHAVHLAPDGHRDRPACLCNLGDSFITRFHRLGELSDLKDAVLTLRRAVHYIPDGHPNKPACLSNLGTSLITRFERLGELSDLEDAISIFRHAVRLTPDSHLDKPSRLNNLGNSFFTRFRRLGELSDVEDAILMHRHAVHLIPDGHPRKPSWLGNLGNSFTARFRRLGELSDVEDAISTHMQAVHLIPDGHPDKPDLLNDLGSSLKARFERLGDLSDLEDAISIYRHAVHLAPSGHPHQPSWLSNLGNSLVIRFYCLGELSDVEDAISTHKHAIHLTPDGHPDKPSRLNNLGNSFRIRFDRLGEPSDLAKAISLYSHSASSPIGPISTRFGASQNWISCAQRNHHPSLLRAYYFAISLLPQRAWIGLSLIQRYAELQQSANVVREAAAAALDSGFSELAVEWLEQGRSIVWGELLQLRDSYEQLSNSHPEHARRLEELSTALDNAGVFREQSFSSFVELSAVIEDAGATDIGSFSLSETPQGTANYARESLEHAAIRQRALAVKRDKLLQEIRCLSGFERFLLPKRFSELHASAHSGPVVMLNAAESRCDALIILANVDHVIQVPLLNFGYQRSTRFQGILKSFLRQALDQREGKITRWDHGTWETFLAPLWKCVIKPVMDALAFSIPGDLSRIFWCPTGPFVFLPLHAAGFYDTEHSAPGHKIFDFVVSSYVPTLGILAPSRNNRVILNNDLRLLAIRQPSSDGQSHLPGVHTELEHIKDVIKSSSRVVLLESSAGTVEEVLGLMKESDWVHFACHGIQDATRPTDSGLCLANRRRLNISNIIGLSRSRGGLAFLSACQTATGDEGLSDEAVHIAAGMLFAGYGGVIGTMWSISDKLAPIVAKDVYEHLFRDGKRPDYRDAAWALHDAIEGLREGAEVSFNEWVPFIHVGL